jgi:hypothetical protein
MCNKYRLFELMHKVGGLPVNEVAEYQDTDDGNQITVVKRDNYHHYQYCDGVLYELSTNGGDIVVNINDISETEENTFFDTMYDLLHTKYPRLYDKFSYTDISIYHENYGFTDEIHNMKNVQDLDKYFVDKNDPNFNQEFYDGFKAIIEHYQNLDEYQLIDSNHRFRALKELGKKYIMVDLS